MKRFRGGLVVKAHRLLYHSTLGLRVMKKKKSLGGQRFRLWGSGFKTYRGTSLIRKLLPLGPYSRPMPRAVR